MGKRTAHASRVQGSRGVSDPEQLQQMLSEGSEAADFIRGGIVQATMNERGAYGASSKRQCWPAHALSAMLFGWLCTVGLVHAWSCDGHPQCALQRWPSRSSI